VPSGPAPRILKVVSGLVVVLTEHMTIAVQDGPDKSVRHVPDELLVVGITEESQPGYTSVLTRQEGMGRGRYAEDFTIQCCFSVFNGSTDVPGIRARADEVLTEVHDVLNLAVDQALILGGAVQYLQLGETFAIVPVRDGDGAGVGVLFDVVGQLL